jgi:hypothetical protein
VIKQLVIIIMIVQLLHWVIIIRKEQYHNQEGAVYVAGTSNQAGDHTSINVNRACERCVNVSTTYWMKLIVRESLIM